MALGKKLGPALFSYFGTGLSSDSRTLNNHHLGAFLPPLPCLSKYSLIIPSETVATSYQCLRTYISGLPW